MNNHKSYKTNDWSLTDQQIDYLILLLHSERPKSICEFGAGVTTQIFEDYVDANPDTRLLTIEHSEQYAQKHTKLFNLIKHGSIAIADRTFKNTNFYEGLEFFFYDSNQSENYRFDLVLIDGPFGYDCDNSRCQLLDFIYYDLISDNCTFIIHDSERTSNKNIQNIFEEQLTNRSFNYHVDYVGNSDNKQMKVYHISRK